MSPPQDPFTISDHLPFRRRRPYYAPTPQTLPFFGGMLCYSLYDRSGLCKVGCREENMQPDLPLQHTQGPYGRKALLAATVLIFVCSNLHVIEQPVLNILPPLTLGANPPNIERKLIDIRLSLNAFDRVNYFMSELSAGAHGYSTTTAFNLTGATTHMSFGALWLFGDEKFDPSTSHALIQVLPLLVTNIVSASLMGYKMWQYQQQIKVQLDFPKNKKTRVERILVILTESGMIYRLIWILFLYTILTNQGEDTTGYKTVANMIPQLSAIFPVIIVLPVSFDRTHLESTVIGISTNTDSDPIHFVGNTTGSTGTMGTLRMGVPTRLADTSRSSDVDLVVAEKEERRRRRAPRSRQYRFGAN
ncbi:hypothetical protein C8J57DRAFT_1483849 [Mycena rebaudengoi]|nr:hypothetical protein C8J57DRAFT_1483849 [Mycena rebaudengoi]